MIAPAAQCCASGGGASGATKAMAKAKATSSQGEEQWPERRSNRRFDGQGDDRPLLLLLPFTAVHT